MIIEERTTEQQTRILANYLRNDRLHEAKNNSNSVLYKILLGLAGGWIDFRNSAKQVIDNYNIYNTIQLLEEWESAVGIPDNIFDNSGDIETRKKNILLKIAGSKVSTALQFERVANILGFNVIVESGYEHCVFPLTFPIIFCDESEMPFITIVSIDKKYKPQTFPLAFPIEFRLDGANILKLFFNKIKPANTKIIFRYV